MILYRLLRCLLAIPIRIAWRIEVVGLDRAVTLAIAPGLGQPRPRRRGEARGLHVVEASADAILVRTHLWRDGLWVPAAERRFPRGAAALTPS